MDASNDLDLKQYLGGDYFKGRDVAEPILLTIYGIVEQEFKDGSKKPVLAFEEDDRLAPLGRQNLKRLMEKFGDRTSAWIGRQVMLTQGAEYQGNPSLVVSPYGRKAAQPGKPQRAAAPAPQEEDIPF